jgi:hypothetical protein
MTITTVYSPVVFNIVGAGPYIFSFDLIDASNIRCEIDGVPINSGAFTVTVSGEPPIYSGGSVTLVSPPASGVLSVYRTTNATQNVDYQPYTPFPADTTEFALDKLTLLAQERGSGGGGGTPGEDYVDLISDQTIGGEKTFVERLVAEGVISLSSIAAAVYPVQAVAALAGIGNFGVVVNADAAQDGTIYGRQNGQWVPTGTVGGYVDLTTDQNIGGLKVFTETLQAEALASNSTIAAVSYPAQQGDLVGIGGFNVLANAEAPKDGTSYARRNGAWVSASTAGGPGVAKAGGTIISDGSGVQSIADCFGIASCTINGNVFDITLSSAITQAKMIITCNGGLGLSPIMAQPTRKSDTVFAIGVLVEQGGSFNASVAAGLAFTFMVHDAGA